MNWTGALLNRKNFLISVAVFTGTILSNYSHRSLGVSDSGKLLNALHEGGHIIYFRHAEKSHTPNISSSLPEQFRSCLLPEQLLTEAGVSSMRSLGQQFEELNIPVGQVISSPVCRCIESAWFSFGDVTIDPSLNGVYEKNSTGEFVINEAVTEEFAFNLRRNLIEVPEEGTNTVLFAHSSNILALTGLQLQQGEAAIFKPDGRGHFIYVGRVTLSEWAHWVEK